jgi:nucleoside-diphosphate-sugar epimerase
VAAAATARGPAPADGLHVVFGAGPLGLAVAHALAAHGSAGSGHRVRLVNRSGHAPEAPRGAEVVAADASDPAAARRAAAGAAVVYQCAQPPYTAWPERFPPLQAAILRAAAAAGATLVLADNLYGYRPHDVARDGPLTEDAPARPVTRKGRVRAAMAEAALAAHARGEVRVAIGRASDFYGPGVTGSALGERAFAPLVAGRRAMAVGDPDQPHTYTVVEDFARALVTLGARAEALGRAWHVPSPPTRTTRDLLALAFAAAGHLPRVGATGPLGMRLAGLFVPEARETVELMYEFTRPFVVSHARYAAAFGDDHTPHEAALARTVAWYRTAYPAHAAARGHGR